MNRDETLKKRHERAVGNKFIELYNKREKTNYIFKEQGEAPDLLYEDRSSGQKLGVEIVTAYGDENDAKGAWEIARGKRKDYDSGLIIEPELRSLFSVEECIRKKFVKRPSVNSSCYLVIDVRDPLADEDTGEWLREHLVLPEKFPYARTFILVPLTSEYRIYELYDYEKLEVFEQINL